MAYLLGLEGAALLRGMRDGFGDQAFVEARISEIRALLDDPALLAAGGIEAVPGTISVDEVYQKWAPTYDGPNSMIELEEPIVRGLLDALPIGTVLDAACGTARHASYLASLGHEVIGVDASADMLAIAATKLPDTPFHRADLHDLPLPDASVDAVVCALALAYLPDLRPVFAEFARVLRPGGHLVVSDAHELLAAVRPTLPRAPGPDGRASILTEYHRPLSEYLAAALPLGFQVRHCSEPYYRRTDWTSARAANFNPSAEPPTVSWELTDWIPETTGIALNVPSIVVWDFQLA